MSDSEMDKSPVSTKRARESSFNEEPLEEPTDPKDQVEKIKQLQEQNLQDGKTWCLISKAWHNRWVQYCTRMSSTQPEARSLGEKSHPGPIDNRSILKNGRLAEDLEIQEDVYAVPEVAWAELISWYGSKDDSEPIQRSIITNDSGRTVELYPPQFKLYSIESSDAQYMSQLTRCPVVTLSEISPKADFVNAVKNAFDLVEDSEIQAWILKEEPDLTSVPNVTIQVLRNATLLDLDHQNDPISLNGTLYVAVEVKDKITGKFPSDDQPAKSDSSSVSSASSVFANGFNNLTTSSSTTTPPSYTRGVCGLQNLGNTCFMNSALQCLSNTSQLTKWFLADNYKKDLNRDNPLGMKGQVAEAYGELISTLWSGSCRSVAPRDFKYTIGRFNSSFNGYQQHDTQELLAFLLDGLHEDLNRIIKKPYIELPDFDGMQDAEIAQKSWDYHRARNDSVIVDLFQGQFKSRLICEECKNVSVTFDPFMYLSLPLPIKKQIKTSIVYVPYNPSERLCKMVVTLSKEASIAHLQKEVAKMMSVEDPNTLLVIEMYNHKTYKVFPQYEPVATIGTTDVIYVYQLPGPVPPLPKKKPRYSYNRLNQPDVDDDKSQPIDENQLIVFPVYCATATSSTNGSRKNDRVTQFGDPIILAVPRKDANNFEKLYHLVSSHVERYTQFKLFEEVKEHQQTEDVITEANEDQPPGYETIVQDQDVEQVPNQEEQESSGTDGMDIDSAPQPNLIHTAAAVTAAGGKKVEPMSNLFGVKVFTSSYSDELLPSIHNLSGLPDLRERIRSEQEQRELYWKQQNESSSEEEEQGEKDTEMQDSLVLPSTMEDEDEDDQVEDASALFTEAPKDESFERENSDDSDRFSTEIGPASPPALPKRKVTCPPSTIIRQGEGILLEWTPAKAQQLFGSPRSYSFEEEVCTDAWKDMYDLGDPNEVDNQAQEKKNVTLSDCLDEFTKEEALSEEDLWYCPKCKKHQRATKKFDLWRMPEIMVVHLKRFSHSRTWRDKIDALIDFPISELDLTDRVLSIEDHTNIADEDRLIYDLYAVDNHFGGLGGGHYTSYAQNFEDKNWYNFDDSHVSKVEANDCKTTAAYLLFYKRRRSSNDEPVQTVEEIIKEAQEKQQAAQVDEQHEQESHSTVQLLSNQSDADELSSSDDERTLEREVAPPTVDDDCIVFESEDPKSNDL